MDIKNQFVNAKNAVEMLPFFKKKKGNIFTKFFYIYLQNFF